MQYNGAAIVHSIDFDSISISYQGNSTEQRFTYCSTVYPRKCTPLGIAKRFAWPDSYLDGVI